MSQLEKGIPLPSRRPKRRRHPLWGESEKQHILTIRRANPTYGKAKFAVILRRDHDLKMSESIVGRILKHLMNKGLITKSIAAPHLR